MGKIWRRAIIAVGAIVLVAATAAGAPATRPPAPGKHWRGRRYAVLIAAGRFADRSFARYTLKAPKNDVQLMVEVLHDRYRFRRGDITLIGFVPGELGPGYRYADKDANAQAILAGYRWLATRRDCDYAVVYYSGHGTLDFKGLQRPDEPDGYAEALVPFDAEPSVNLIYDDTLYRLSSAIPARQTTLIYDTCFSGGLSKEVLQNASPKFIPLGDDALVLPPRPKGRRLKDGTHVVVLAACESNQMTAEARSGGPDSRWVSPFTQALHDTVMGERTSVTYGGLLRGVKARLGKWLRSQTPVRDGGYDGWVAIAP